LPDQDQPKAKVTVRTAEGENGEHKLEGLQKVKTSMIEEKEDRIHELEHQILHKDKFIQQLVTDVGKINLRINQLESRVESQAHRIQQLEGKATEVGQPSESDSLSEASPELKSLGDIAGDSWADIVECEIAQGLHSEPEAVYPQKTEDTAPLKVIAPCPAAVTEDLPALPKVPQPSAVVQPAPKLSFPIMNGGRIGSKASTKTPAINTPTFPWPVGQPAKDIRDMSQSEREDLYQGPTITVIIGDAQIRGVPKHMFMAASPKVREYFEQNPQETYIPFPRAEVAVPVMDTIKNWLECMGTYNVVFSIKLKKDPAHDLLVRRNCIYLGMDKYVAHFTRQYCDRIRDEGLAFLTFDTMAIIEKNTEDNDSLFFCLANNIASLRQRGKIPEPEKFDEFLAQPQLSRLSETISKINSKLVVSRNKKKSQSPS
jgi:uncharacterized coiled-coil protein SlyX